ncbi:glycoside hydrolase family 25 protein [Ruminococcus sp.]|uniref:glycoside hydrolase family 25 protein n=1 Tax=Ruminococcus sp. TaxID=41978 RepID=UPI00307C09FF
MKGIDVSKHQGNVNWSHVKADGVKFAIIRAGYGKEAYQKDIQFENNYAGCKSNGIPVGVYWYSYATTPDEARKEAAVCLSIIKGKTFEYPVYFDIEEPSVLAKGKAACTAIAKAFLEAVEQAGYFVGIYSSKVHLENCITEELRARYAVWVAHYGVDKTTYHGQYGIWQKSSTGKVYGISGNVDVNECYIDYPAAIKKKGLNGFKAASAKPAKPAQVAPAKKWVKGQAVKIRSNTPLFANETATTPSARLSAGTYYIYDGVPCKLGRYRVTTTAASCGKKPAGKYVTGYASWDNFREV